MNLGKIEEVISFAKHKALISDDVQVDVIIRYRDSETINQFERMTKSRIPRGGVVKVGGVTKPVLAEVRANNLRVIFKCDL